MLYHYVLIAYRSFRKHKGYALLNIFGLSLGITCSLIIFLFVHDEFTYDHQHIQRKNIYRLNAAYHLPKNGGFEEYAAAGPAIGDVLTKDFAEVERVVRFRRIQDVVIEKPGTDDRYYETFFAADSTLLDVFTFPLISGDPKSALLDINTLIITRAVALRYFGRTDVLGENLRLPADSTTLKITGVMEDHPSNTHLRPEFLISMETFRVAYHTNLTNWWSFGFQTYLKVSDIANIQSLEDKIKFISRKYIPDQEDGSGYKQEYSLIPLSDIHLHSNLRSELEPNSKAAYVYIFLIIGIFVLVIACINFMNLATARAAMRAKEIGMRKVAGAIRQQLVGQFLGEAFLMTILATAIALIVVFFLLPAFNNFTGKSLQILSSSFFWITLLGVALFVAFLAGSYPSLFLSAFRPVETLKGNFRNSAKGNGLRKVLVIFQFSISIFLIAGTLIIVRHLDYIRSVNLGFDQAMTVIIPTRFVPNAARDFGLLKEELKKVTGITNVSLSSRVPGREMGNNVVRLGWDDDATWSDMRFLGVDHEFVDTYQLDLAAGRSFSLNFPSDQEQAFMLNESGARRLGFSKAADALGQKLRFQNRRGEVIGVLKDFHFMSANVAIEPFIMVMHMPWTVGYVSVKLASHTNLREAVRNVERTFHETLPSRIFEFSFLDEEFDKQYKAEDRFMTIFFFFAVVAILIACLGLYGLAMFMAELRIKEIGIRKVLGASEGNVVALMSKDFIKLVAIAFVISAPLSYWVMEQWLASFPYREKINPLLFFAAGVIAFGIAIMTVSFQAVKAARSNPVKSLSAT